MGLYAIYASKRAGCRVLAVEPEAQNYALLLENILLNGVQDRVTAANLAITSQPGLGRLYVHAITKGGAYNQFFLDATAPDAPEEHMLLKGSPITQLQMGVSLDELVSRFALEAPTHLKIDVDGNEPEIIAGAAQVLSGRQCRHVLMEIQPEKPAYQAMLTRLDEFGYRGVSRWENPESNRDRAGRAPAVTMIFEKVLQQEPIGLGGR